MQTATVNYGLDDGLESADSNVNQNLHKLKLLNQE
jgi:hypothetical protein